MCINLEIVLLLQTTGIVFNIKTGILGLTFLAWANSIGGEPMILHVRDMHTDFRVKTLYQT